MTALDQVAHSLAEANRLQPVVNAFIEFRVPGGLRDAAASDRRLIAGGSRGPLDGVCVAMKDMFDTPGRRCTFGARIGQLEEARTNAACVERLEAAGAVNIGFLNMSEYALGPTGHNATYGHCRNPWDSHFVSGGSSSGAGAAVAANIIRAALGSDTGGSVRIPASCCGVTGLKPTHGTIDMAGALPLAPSLDCIGVLARSASDCQLLFDTIASLPAPASRLLEGAAPNLVYPRQHIAAACDPQITGALDEAIDLFRATGAVISERPLPDLMYLHRLADRIQLFESNECHRSRLASFADTYTPHVLRRLRGSPPVDRTEYLRALSGRPGRVDGFIAEALGKADALIIPTLGDPVPTIADTDEESNGALPGLVAAMTRWTRWINYLGLPALSVPCGIDSNGLPIGFQLVGRPRSEATLLHIAKLFQRHSQWHLRIPAIAEGALSSAEP